MTAAGPLYDELGKGYAGVRRPDPRIAARIEAALGDAATVVNVGAGAGSYEPPGRAVTAVEPSAEMIAQRPAGAAPAISAGAEALPFADDSFDAAMAVLTVHHWDDLDAGLGEMRRVAGRIVLVTFDPGPLRRLWFVRDYFPLIVGLHAERISSRQLGTAKLPAASVSPIPVPHDCTDLFFAALWRRPELVFDEDVVRPMWVWNRLEPEVRREGRERLAADLASGAWEERNGHLRELDELDVGLRLVVSG